MAQRVLLSQKRPQEAEQEKRAGWGGGRGGEVVQNDPCNAKGAQPGSPRPLPAGLARSPADSPREVRQPTSRAREMEVCDPEVPTPITTTDPDARSAGDLTRAGPCQPQAAPSQSAPAVPGRSAAPKPAPCARGALIPATVAGRPALLRGKGEGRVTGKKAEQAAREALTAVRKAPPPLL